MDRKIKQYTTPEQTAKLIELGVEQPKSIEVYRDGHCVPFVEQRWVYSIGELISFLPYDGVSDRRLEFDGFHWIVDWDSFDKIHQTMQVELVDALYDMVVKLKEKGVI